MIITYINKLILQYRTYHTYFVVDLRLVGTDLDGASSSLSASRSIRIDSQASTSETYDFNLTSSSTSSSLFGPSGNIYLVLRLLWRNFIIGEVL